MKKLLALTLLVAIACTPTFAQQVVPPPALPGVWVQPYSSGGQSLMVRWAKPEYRVTVSA